MVDVRRTREHLERANHLNDVILHFVSFNGELTTVVVVIFIAGRRRKRRHHCNEDPQRERRETISLGENRLLSVLLRHAIELFSRDSRVNHGISSRSSLRSMYRLLMRMPTPRT